MFSNSINFNERAIKGNCEEELPKNLSADCRSTVA